MNFSIGRGAAIYQHGELTYKKLIIPNHPRAQDVAGNHALLDIRDGIATIRPVNLSHHPVFVNGFAIKCKQLDTDHLIRLGKNYSFALHFFFKIDQGKIVGERKGFDFSEEFSALQTIWQEENQTEKKLRQKAKTLSGVAKIPYVGGLLSHFITKDMEETTQQNLKDQQVQTRFICPMCRQPLLEKSWEEWRQEQGHHCGAKWTSVD